MLQSCMIAEADIFSYSTITVCCVTVYTGFPFVCFLLLFWESYKVVPSSCNRYLRFSGFAKCQEAPVKHFTFILLIL